MITVVNPLACVMLSKNERLEGKYLEGRISSLAVSSSGLWLRQKNDSSGAGGGKGESIIHALRAGQEDGELYDVTIFVFAGRDKFVKRIDARRAKLANDFWQLQDVIVTYPNKASERSSEYFLETELTLAQIHDSFSPPETISFWALPAFIKTLKEAGFSALRHRLHWHSILISPLFYAAMILMGAMLSMRPPRQGKQGLMIVISIFAGVLVYFLNDLVSAFGLSGKLPIIVAAWAPVSVVTLVSVATLLHLEDG
jgi:lipopolysaccharide export system permease protein